MPLSAGDRVGRFKLVELLGEGGMGSVYRAEDTVLGRAVALKVLHAKDKGDGAAPGSADAAKLLHEARAAAALNHPNAVAVFDVGEADGVAYIAMELLSGKTLRAYVHDEGVPLEKKIAWLIDVASALEAAHKRGIVHRDIKPENVFVRSDGVIKVLDFGIARRVSSPVDPTAATLGGELTMTATGATVGSGKLAGTPLYMAPEQLRGEAIDGRADQFGWAVVAYELLTGSLPWDTSLGGLQLVSQILSRTPEAPSAKRAEISKGVDRVVMRALAKVPAERFEDMGALIDALSDAGGETASARGEALQAPPAGQVATHDGKGRSAVRVALLVVVVAVGGGVLAWRARKAAPQVTSATASASVGLVAGPPDYGSKMSTNEAAMTAYRAGMQAMVDAVDQTARDDLARAATLDPGFAAAHLRRALMMGQGSDAVAREHFEKALSLRADLGAHDRALLDALTAALRQPADPAEIERAFGAIEGMADPDARYAACHMRFFALAQDEAAIKGCRSAWELDGAHAGAHRVEGQALLHAEHREAARSAFAECVRISSSATDCLAGLFHLDANDGRCADAAALARKLIAVEPENAGWREELISTLVNIGEPSESVEEAVKQYLVRLHEEDRVTGEAQTRFVLAVLRGDFNEAAAHAQAWERGVAADSYELPGHWQAFYTTWSLEIEMGRLRAAGDRAERYQRRRAAWDTSGDEAGGELLALLYVSGRLTRAAFEKQRDVWLAKRPRPLSFDDWFPGFGHAIVTDDDAQTAIAALEHIGGVPTSGLPGAVDYTLGDAYLRAGEPGKAIPFLTRATTSCMALAGPIEQTRAFADLAMARSGTDDSAGACAALRAVLSRWGKAAASVTAAASRRLWGKLGCSP